MEGPSCPVLACRSVGRLARVAPSAAQAERPPSGHTLRPQERHGLPFQFEFTRGELLSLPRVAGTPPKGNANFAWVQHFIHHLAPDGFAGFVLANGSMSSNQSGEGDIRKAVIEADLVDCMVALPGQLFYSTQIPVCLWLLAKNKQNGKRCDRRQQTLFIDARKLGTLIDRVHRERTDADIARITGGGALRWPKIHVSMETAQCR